MDFTSKIKVDFKEQFWRILKTTLIEKKKNSSGRLTKQP